MRQRRSEGAKVGRNEDFAEFVAMRGAALLRLALLLTSGNRPAAEDLVQEAFIETYVRWWRIRDPQSREAYTRRILVRSASRGWRARRSILDLDEASTNEMPHSDAAPPVETALDVWAALRSLSAMQRAVLVLRYYDDQSEAQIAELLGCSQGSVKTHASRGLRALGGLLDSEGYPLSREPGGTR